MTLPLSLPPAARVRVTGGLHGGQVPAGAVYIGRRTPTLPAAPWANPYPLRRHGLAECWRLFVAHLARHPRLVQRARRELTGRPLACWCRLDAPCHGDIWLTVIRESTPDGEIPPAVLNKLGGAR